MATKRLAIHLLGAFRVSVGPRTIAEREWTLHKAKSLVKVLALAPQHCLHHEHVTDRLWPDLGPEDGANNLHRALYVVRRSGHSAASLRSWLWPLSIVLTSIGISVVVLGDVHSPVRPLLAVWFLCLCPGMAFVRLLDIEDGYIQLTLAIALSLVLDAAVATALLYAHRWSPADILGLLAGLSLVGVALDVTVAYRRKRSTGHVVRGAREREQRIQASTVAALTVRMGGLDMEVQPAEVEGRQGHLPRHVCEPLAHAHPGPAVGI